MKILLYVFLLTVASVQSRSFSFHQNQNTFLSDWIKSPKEQILENFRNLQNVDEGPYINSDDDDQSDVNAPIMELPYYGNWYSDSYAAGSQFNYFGGNNGYAEFVADDEHSDQMNDVVYFTFFDGQYIDQKAAQVNFWYDNATDFNVTNSTFSNVSITFSLTYFDNLKEISNQNCTGGYQLSFVDSSTNLPYNVFNSSYEDAVAYFWLNSTDCNINVNALVSANDSSRESNALYYAIMVTLICLVHLFGAVQIIKNLTLNETDGIRYSLITLSIFAIWDVFMCLFHLYDALTTEDYFHYFIIPAFWYFILSSIFETRLILVVWKTKYYHTFQSPSEVRRGIAVFYVKFYGAMLISLFLAYTFLPATWFIGITSGFFVPQIAHIAIRGQKYKFDPTYAFLLGFVRILIPIYVKGCPASLFKLTPHYGFIIFYISFVAFQILVMYLQAVLGSRFFIPKCFLPPKFNYYHKLSVDSNVDDPETCAICMENLTDAPVSSSAGLLNRRPKDVTIMITPCRHKFHPSCLRQWMEIKLECPFCRAPVPSLE